MNSVTVPSQADGSLFNINVEHTRSLQFKVSITREDQVGVDPLSGSPVFVSTSFAPLVGALQPGQDNIWGDSTMTLPDDGMVHSFHIDISLIDPTLSPKNEFKRKCDISSPGTIEP